MFVSLKANVIVCLNDSSIYTICLVLPSDNHPNGRTKEIFCLFHFERETVALSCECLIKT